MNRNEGTADEGIIQIGPDGGYKLAPMLAFVGPYQNGRPMGTGLILQVPTAVNANGTFLATHNLIRVPVYVLMLTNAPNFPGDLQITAATSTTATIKVENTAGPNSYYYIT